MLTRQTGAAVSVGSWERIGRGKLLRTLRSARRREALQRPRRQERAGAYRGGRPHTACFVLLLILRLSSLNVGLYLIGVMGTCKNVGSLRDISL